MGLPFTSLNAATSTGVGVARDYETSLRYHTIHVTVAGSPNGANVSLEGSHDGQRWFLLGAVGVGTGQTQAVRTVNEHFVRYVRANLTDLSGGTSPTVTATIASAAG
ncbi:hypothetical protein ACIODS_12215 [Micromonospora chalcea]|uniref:hypothetical protein n=1 Tax=Micromonospora chalcea TaxID=1874 RepID=UPI0037F47583